MLNLVRTSILNNIIEKWLKLVIIIQIIIIQFKRKDIQMLQKINLINNYQEKMPFSNLQLILYFFFNIKSITNEIKISFEYTSLQGCSLQIYLGVNNINEDA